MRRFVISGCAASWLCDASFWGLEVILIECVILISFGHGSMWTVRDRPTWRKRMARRFGREHVSLSVLIWLVGDK